MAGKRLRDLGITIGSYPTGEHNAITDVPGVWVGHKTLIYDRPRIARTGLTVIMPREGRIWKENAFAAFHSFNGSGEMTGMHWLSESGLLCYPIALTNTHQVGTVHEALVAYGAEKGLTPMYSLPVVAETWDGWLNDAPAFHVTKEHVYETLAAAGPGPVDEGNVGGGTGMICHLFKGGIGTASRQVETAGEQFTLGVLVQANHGDRRDLRVDGVPVGRILDPERVPTPYPDQPESSSIIIVIATDAPLLPQQCARLARRGAIGLARVGGIGHNGSGDLFLAFSTGNTIRDGQKAAYDIRYLPNDRMNPLFTALAEAVEEAILNTLIAAETMTGYRDHTAHALPLDDLTAIMADHQPPVANS